jgi:DNA-binding transcriptional ArsR family regulator
MAKEQCIPLLKALADETRWRIVRELLAGPATVNELTDRLGASQYNVSKHLAILADAGIVEKERHGKHVRCQVTPNFRQQLSRNQDVLDLGCCTFRFDKLPR